MEEIMNDLGYQKSLEDVLNHKMLIRDLIFSDPIYMTMVFCELLVDSLRPVGQAEVEYEGSTSILHVKGPFNTIDIDYAMCRALAIAVRTGSNEKGIFMDILIHQLITTTGADTCTCMNLLLNYIKNPILFNGFFKVLTIVPGEFQIHLT